MDLEHSVKRSQMALVVIERALNDLTGWTLGGGGIACDAQVTTSPDGVTFWATFPEIAGHIGRVNLCHQGELLWVAPVSPPETGAFEVEITLFAATESVSL